MTNAMVEAPAAYVLATEFHDLVREMIDPLGEEHAYLAVEMLKYAERIMGNVGAAEAPYAGSRRQRHYQIAFAAACGCAAACEVVHRLRLAPVEQARRANRLLASLASIVQPIADEGMDPRSEEEDAMIDQIFGGLGSDDPWRDDDEDEDDDEDGGMEEGHEGW